MEKQPNRRLSFILCLALAVVSAVAFVRVLDAEFINCDDVVYVTQNDHVKAGLTLENIKWAFTTFDQCFWHPLVWLSYILDYQIWRLNPFGYHLTNLVFHILNTILLFLALKSATRSVWKSALVAAFFGIHPLHVESVAWVAERKDVLSTFFFMLAILAYIRYVRFPKVKTYTPVVAFFILGLMSKPMLVTFPFVLLLLDCWQVRRNSFLTFTSEEKAARFTNCHPITGTLFSKLLAEKIPLFILSGVASVIAYIAQGKGEALDTRAGFPFCVRVANALVSYVTYIIKVFWPRNLALFYPHPGGTLPIIQVVGAGFALVCITLLALLSIRRRPYIFVGWFWYAGTLIPVSGIVKFGAHAMADRFTYIPLIGLFIVIVWGASELIGRSLDNDGGYINSGKCRVNSNMISITASIISTGVFAFCTYVQVGYWHDSVRLFEHALKVTKGNYFAYNNLGAALEEANSLDEAVLFYRASLRIEPNQARAHLNLGNVFIKQGKLDEALREYKSAMQFRPNDPMLLNNLAVALAQKGMFDEAVCQLKKAVQINPYIPGIHENFAEVLYLKGDYAGAWREIALCRKNGGQPSDALLKALSTKMLESTTKKDIDVTFKDEQIAK